VDDELLELVPVFVAEARERLQRLADLVPGLATRSAALVEIKREIHTLKGAGRMMAIAPFAELCHATEEVVLSRPPGLEGLLLSAHDALATMVDAVESGEPVVPATELLLEFDRRTPNPASGSDGLSAPARVEPPPAEELRTGEDRRQGDERAAPEERGTSADGEAAENRRADVERRTSEDRSDTAGLTALGLDAFAERGVRVRAAAVVTGRLLSRLEELANLAEDGIRDPHPAQALAVVAASLRQAVIEAGALETRLARTGEEQIEAVLALQIAPLKSTLRSLARSARELARRLGRQIEVELEGEETRLDRRIARELDGALRHLVANAVDHGIESPEERRKAGKPAAGRLRISAAAGGRGVELTIADDGRGIDATQVAQRAVEGGFLPRAALASMSEPDALRLVFLPGFSTRDIASEVSGRGVGLDAVEAAVAHLGGEVRIASTVGGGSRIVLDLPVARRGEQVVLIRVGSVLLAVPAVAVRRIASLSGIAVEERGGHRMAILGDRLIPFVALGEALGLPGTSPEEAGLLIEGSVAGRPIAFSIDRVEGEVELLVRPLPRRARVSALIDGAALLPSGDPIAVLAPQALLGRESTHRRPAASLPAAMREQTRLLLVDDSRVTREMERRILEDAGFRVEVAGDGDEALRRLAVEAFDCLVTDIEMPNLDGFELTAQLRQMERFARLPIVVVSTRERSEDRLRGLRSGADAYLTKQSLVASDLVETVRRLTGN
jgi:chemotaxis protein histidine kinase CheA/CheY-like chemotaxis protein